MSYRINLMCRRLFPSFGLTTHTHVTKPAMIIHMTSTHDQGLRPPLSLADNTPLNTAEQAPEHKWPLLLTDCKMATAAHIGQTSFSRLLPASAVPVTSLFSHPARQTTKKAKSWILASKRLTGSHKSHREYHGP